jgi:hypothetical protein
MGFKLEESNNEITRLWTLGIQIHCLTLINTETGYGNAFVIGRCKGGGKED